MVGFRDLVGTGIAPVSKKTAVKRTGWFNYPDLIFHVIKIFFAPPCSLFSCNKWENSAHPVRLLHRLILQSKLILLVVWFILLQKPHILLQYLLTIIFEELHISDHVRISQQLLYQMSSIKRFSTSFFHVRNQWSLSKKESFAES